MHETLFRLLPCYVAVVDSDLIVRDASDACAGLAGVDRDGLVGQPLLERLAPGTAPEALTDELRRAVVEGRPAEHTVTLQPDAAPGRPYNLKTVPVTDGVQRYALVHFAEAPPPPTSDDTRFEELHAAIRTIKHDINNPLTGALGNINLLLRREDLDEKTRRRLTVAEQEMKKIGQLVLQLASLAPPRTS
jgi:signal transduction histidine kinase